MITIATVEEFVKMQTNSENCKFEIKQDDEYEYVDGCIFIDGEVPFPCAGCQHIEDLPQILPY